MSVFLVDGSTMQYFFALLILDVLSLGLLFNLTIIFSLHDLKWNSNADYETV